MANINEILARAAALRNETALNSIDPERAGGIMYDTLIALNELWLQQGAALVISKIYASVAAMNADTSPVADLTGKPIRPGMIVVIASSDSDNGSVYRYNGTSSPSWSLVGKIGNLEPVDSLDSDSTQLPLAAHQGKVLDEKISQLASNVVRFPFTDEPHINAAIKELYVPQSALNVSMVTEIRIYKAYYNGVNYRTGLYFYGSQNYAAYKSFDTQAEALAACENIWGNAGVYAIIDWENVNTDLFVYAVSISNRASDIYNSPTIYTYLKTIKKDDLETEIVSDNIANPKNIQAGAFVNSSGTFSDDAQNLWTYIRIPVTPGVSYTLGGFVMNRTSNWYAFYNGDTLVSHDTYNPNTTPVLTLQAPAGVTDLYINIKSRETGSNYNNLQVNIGTELKDYDVYEEGVTKILGYTVTGSGGSGDADLSTLIVDLPVSDGSGIASGYAYIDSTDRAVKVKA